MIYTKDNIIGVRFKSSDISDIYIITEGKEKTNCFITNESSGASSAWRINEVLEKLNDPNHRWKPVQVKFEVFL